MKQWLGLGLVFVLCVAATGYFLGLFRIALENTLETNGQWIVTKTTHDLGVMGEESYRSGLQALAGNRLHLDAWHGYHEVYHQEYFPLDYLQCTIVLDADSWALLLLRTAADAPAYGLRLSTDDAHPPAYLTISPEGEFLSRSSLEIPALSPGRYDLALQRDPTGLSVRLNGEAIATWEGIPDAVLQIGFRGGAQPVAIDDVLLSHGRDVLIEEYFSRATTHSQSIHATLLMTVLGALVLLLLVAAITRQPRRALQAFTLLSACALAAAAPLYIVGAPHWAMRYPPLDQALQTKEQAWLATAFDKVADEMAEAYPEPIFVDGPTIVMLGTSQTFGGGARTVDETFVSVARREVDAALDSPVRLIRAGIPGVKTPMLHQFYEQHLRAYRPCLIVLNVGVNDSGNPQFEEDLRAFADLLEAEGVHLALSLEAHNWSFETHTHEIMRRLAEEEHRDIPVLNPHSHLAAVGDKGLLWWDFVHPTSYGHRLLGEYFGAELLRILPELECDTPQAANPVSQ